MKFCISKPILFLNNLFLKAKSSLAFWLEKKKKKSHIVQEKLLRAFIYFFQPQFLTGKEYFQFFSLFSPGSGQSRSKQ